MATDHASQATGTQQRRYGWRLRFLLGLNVLVLGLFIFSRLDLSQAKRFGSWGQSAYELFNPPAIPELSATGRQLMADVKALGGEAQRIGRTPRVMGLFGGNDAFHVRLNGTELTDQGLKLLLQKYGNRIQGLDLRNTKVSDAGLKDVAGLANLHQLTLGNEDLRHFSQIHWPTSPITDAGLAHLRNMPQLMNLYLNGLPVTDSGLAAIANLPNLAGLYLCRTKVQGPGLSRLKSLPTLAVLSLDESQVTDAGLSHLAGASNLQFLSLTGVSLTAEGLKALALLPRLRQVDLTRCGLLDEEVDKFLSSKPGLKIERR